MALIKLVSPGESLIFSIGSEQVEITLTEKSGRKAALKIEADKSVGIMAVDKEKIWVGTPA